MASDTDALTPQEIQELRWQAVVEALERTDRKLAESFEELATRVDKNHEEVMVLRAKKTARDEIRAGAWDWLKKFGPWIAAAAAWASKALGGGK